ncbi:MAG: cellulase family glycosylhydrolase [Clostridia bacterium]|nr:cellulase family glycosylhydrolase [Clostridia bacterium]
MRIWQGYKKGIDLGGWFSQCDHTEERYLGFIRCEDFAVIKSWGADHVRVPVDYELLEDADASPIESGYAHLERAAGYCRENGLNMIIDLHKTAGFSFDPDEREAGFFENPSYQERFMRLWENIARRFGNREGIAFELLNEVTEREYCDTWNRISHECIKRIRAIAPATPILVGGYWHNSAAAVKDIAAPYDENIVFNFHCYEPLVFTHQGAPWIKEMDTCFRVSSDAPFGMLDDASKRLLPGDCSGLADYPADTRLSPAYFEEFFREAVGAAERHNVPLYCGEYGVIDRATPEDALVWFRMINAAFEKHGIGRAAWSYREMDFGLSDARMDGVRDELIKYL